MSLCSVMFVLSCFGMFKLGAFAERNPGEIWATTKRIVVWLAGVLHFTG